jgi:hypothetical protein
MAGRTLEAGMLSGLVAQTVRPVLIGRFDIVTDPLTAWTGPGTFAPSGTADSALNGQVFVTLAPFVEVSNIVEDQGIGGPIQISISGHDLDEDLLRQIVRDKRKWRGQPCYLWMGLLNADESTVVADPVRIKTGVMTQMTTQRDEEGATVTVTVDKDLGRANDYPWRWIDHPRLFTGDTFSTFIVALSNKPEGLTDGSIRGPGDADEDGFPGVDGDR